MYNESRKQQFLSAEEGAVYYGRAVILFNSSENVESEKGIDLCLFDSDEVADLISSMGYYDRASCSGMLALINTYKRWCKSIGVDGSAEVKLKKNAIDNTSGIRSSMVSSPAHLKKVLDSVLESESKNTADNLYMAVFWMAYAGIRVEDAIKVKKSDVCLDKMIISYGEDDYRIYAEGYEAVKKCVELEEFNRINVTLNYVSKHKRVDSEYLLSGSRGDLSINTIKCRIRDIFKDSDVKLTYQNVLKSGFFFHFMQISAMGYDPDFIHMARTLENNSTDREETDVSVKVTARKFKKLFNDWKRTFYS